MDENLLLSNISTANKKVEHLSEVGYNIVIKGVTGFFFFNPSGRVISAWQEHPMKSASHNANQANRGGAEAGTSAGISQIALVSEWCEKFQSVIQCSDAKSNNFQGF